LSRNCKTLSCFDLCNGMLKQEKAKNVWLKEAYSQTLQMSLRNLDNAFTRFFKTKGGFPNFKKKSNRQSCQYPQNVKVNQDNETVFLPKMGNVKIALSRKFEGKIGTCTVSQDATGKYFISILVDDGKKPAKLKKVKDSTTIGIDLGLKDFAILSSGEKVSNPRNLRNEMQRLKVLQSRASKKKKGSQNRKKANLKVAKLYSIITNKRNDFLHKFTHKLTHNNQVDSICVEDLNVSGMMKNHKLAQTIADVSWSKAIEYLKYKCEWYGKNLIQIGRFEASSKTCSICGGVKKDLTLKDREWTCQACGTKHNRDINASINIKKFGLMKAKARLEEPTEPVESLCCKAGL
jgi:putative transposase